MRMPPMVIDEAILLVDTYFKISAIEDKTEQQFYREELSATLRGLTFFSEFQGHPTFRNVSGMTLLLMNITNVISGKWSVGKISKNKYDLIIRYKRDITLLDQVAQAIKYIASSGLYEHFAIDKNCDFLGGTLLLGYHTYLETRGDLATPARENLLSLHGSRCAICHDDLSFTYGEMADKLIELHFAAPISWYTHKAQPTLGEYLLLCPNCHKLAHCDVGFFTEEALKRAVAY